MNLRSTLTTLLLISLSLPLVAQQGAIDTTQERTLSNGRTMIKASPLGFIFGNYFLSGERVLTQGLSLGLEVGTRFPSPGRTYTSQYYSYRSGGLLWPSVSNLSYFTITPELRWYTNGGPGHGFYISLYYRYLDIKQRNIQANLLIPQQGKAPLDGVVTYQEHLRTHALGLGIGAQWLLGRKKNIVLDWYIIGVSNGRGSGWVEGSYKFYDKQPHKSEIDASTLENLLLDETESDSEGVKTTLDKQAQTFRITGLRTTVISPRLGLSIGFRF